MKDRFYKDEIDEKKIFRIETWEMFHEIAAFLFYILMIIVLDGKFLSYFKAVYLFAKTNSQLQNFKNFHLFW